MNSTQVYVVSLGIALIAYIAMRNIVYLSKLFRCYNALCAKHFSYSLVLERHRLLEPLSRVELFYYLTYLRGRELPIQAAAPHARVATRC